VGNAASSQPATTSPTTPIPGTTSPNTPEVLGSHVGDLQNSETQNGSTR
jgi:hypothetical protein